MPLAYTEWRHEGAPLAILIHGNKDHGRSWDRLAGRLSADYHIIAPDLRGHGDSSWSQDGRYNFAAYLSDLDALCAQLKVSQQRTVTLIGHSLGAHIALRYAGVYPDHIARLIAIEAVGAPPEIETARESLPIERRMRNWFEERRAASLANRRPLSSVAEGAERMRSLHEHLSPAQALHLARHGLRRQPNGTWAWKHDRYLAVWPFPDITLAEAQALWRRITCPSLFLYGRRSWPSAIPDMLMEAMPAAKVEWVERSGHWPHHDALDECVTAIRAFTGRDTPG